jgi:hypothetical protein
VNVVLDDLKIDLLQINSLRDAKSYRSWIVQFNVRGNGVKILIRFPENLFSVNLRRFATKVAQWLRHNFIRAHFFAGQGQPEPLGSAFEHTGVVRVHLCAL